MSSKGHRTAVGTTCGGDRLAGRNLSTADPPLYPTPAGGGVSAVHVRIDPDVYGGVVVSHTNIIANLDQIIADYFVDPDVGAPKVAIAPKLQ